MQPSLIVILEGPDGGGKTTLAQTIARHYQCEVHHEGPPPLAVHPLEHYGSLLQRYRGQRVVLDRFALGERVYGPIVRKKDRLGEDGWRVMSRLIRAARAVQVLCLPPLEMCHEAWASGREELVRDEEKFNTTYETYCRLAHTQDVIYDRTRQHEYDEHLFSVLNQAQFIKDRQLPMSMIGTRTATLVLVGDRVNAHGGRLDLPFFSTTASSQFLNLALAAAGVPEDSLALINAHTADGAPNPDLQFLRHGFMYRPRVVTLGRAAYRTTRAAGIAVDCAAEHPQYWSRFKHAQLATYGSILRHGRTEMSA